MKKIILTMLIAVCIATTACNTMRGVGKDIESAGEAIQKATDKK
ncbi:MAG: entericidin A/B family lipoprotein [Nitrospirae bacterium]|nr:entericidin A/B family lipoprotein [Nitrospirota bacterium]